MKFALCFITLFIAAIAAPLDDAETIEKTQREIGKIMQEVREDFERMHREERVFEINAHNIRHELIVELDVLLSKQKAVEKHISDELAKNPKDMVHKWTLETELDAIKVLAAHLAQLEKRLKAQQGHEFSSDESSDDVYDEAENEKIRHEIQMKVEEARKELFHIIHMAHMYETSTKKDEEKKLIIAEIDKFMPVMRALEKTLDAEIAKKKEDPLHMWILETERDMLKTMDKHINDLETRFKAEKTFDEDETYADTPDKEWEETIRTIGRNAMEAYVHFEDLLRKEREHHHMVAAEKIRLIADLDKTIPKLKAVEKTIKDEIAKKHENELLNWALQAQLDGVKLLEVDLAKLEARLKMK